MAGGRRIVRTFGVFRSSSSKKKDKTSHLTEAAGASQLSPPPDGAAAGEEGITTLNNDRRDHSAPTYSTHSASTEDGGSRRSSSRSTHNRRQEVSIDDPPPNDADEQIMSASHHSDVASSSHHSEDVPKEDDDVNCPICLDAMNKADLDHPIQCPTRTCRFNFCRSCIERLITSSKDDYMMASDGNMHVKVFLLCPNCRSDLKSTIRDTALLRRADTVKAAKGLMSDDGLTANKLRLKKQDLTSVDVQKVLSDARIRESEFFVAQVDSWEENENWVQSHEGEDDMNNDNEKVVEESKTAEKENGEEPIMGNLERTTDLDNNNNDDGIHESIHWLNSQAEMATNLLHRLSMPLVTTEEEEGGSNKETLLSTKADVQLTPEQAAVKRIANSDTNQPTTTSIQWLQPTSLKMLESLRSQSFQLSSSTTQPTGKGNHNPSSSSSSSRRRCCLEDW